MGKPIEMIYGIYFSKNCTGYIMPDGKRQGSCVISENATDNEIISNLVASDFLLGWTEYALLDYGNHIHIHHRINGKIAGIQLILTYEEDLKTKAEIFNEIDEKYLIIEDKFEALINEGFKIQEILDIAFNGGFHKTGEN